MAKSRQLLSNARTTVVTVAYSSAGVIRDMLASVPETTAVRVVDNASTDGIAEVVSQYPNSELVSLPSNVGFGRACNAGAKGVTTEFLFFLNPDAQLKAGAISALESFADSNQKLGAANPLLRDAKGSARLKMSSPLPIPAMPRPALDEAGKMPVLSGGAMFVRRHVFEELQGFDPAIFLYHEDHDLSLRIVKAGYDLWHVPHAEGVHAVGTGSLRSTEMARWKGYHMARSRTYALNKFSPGTGFNGTFWPAVLGLLGPTNFLSQRRRAKYVGQIKGALSARSDGGKFEPKSM